MLYFFEDSRMLFMIINDETKVVTYTPNFGVLSLEIPCQSQQHTNK